MQTTGPIGYESTAPLPGVAVESSKPADDDKDAAPDAPRAPASTWFIRDANDFSLVLGGPLYQLFLRMRMVRPPLDLLVRRIVVLTALAWLPLLGLALLSGRAWGGVKIPFLHDFDLHARFLVSLPLLIYAERLVHQRMRPVLGEFFHRNIVRPAQHADFEAILASCLRWRNSVAVEIGLLVFCVVVGHWLWRKQIVLPVATWYADVIPGGGGIRLTWPGVYYAFVSVALFQFILLRWYFRLFIWCRFLWRVSRLDLKLIPTHPDRAGGLLFLQGSAFAFLPILLAHTALLAGLIANRIFHDGAALPMFKYEIAIVAALMLLFAFGPLTVFMPRLAACRRTGLREYGRLASHYVGAFEQKWLRDNVTTSPIAANTPNTADTAANTDTNPIPAPTAEPLLGSADLQSLADLGNSFAVIREMQIVPFGRPTVFRLAIAVLLPLAPLVLTMIPLDVLLDRLVKTLL